jgi:hypothetical protein
MYEPRSADNSRPRVIASGGEFGEIASFMRARLEAIGPAALAVLLAACAHDGPPAQASRTVAPPAAPFVAAPAPPSMPRPARARLAAAVAENRACEACHADVAAEQRASLHGRADLEPAYRRAFAREPMAFCRGCHAPEANPGEPEPDDVAAIGVACVTCHVVDGGVLAAPGGSGRSAPHAIVRDARFATAAACAACHEFAFPTERGRDDGELMQSTIREHARTPGAGDGCADCHMPRGASGRRSHAFVASREPAVLRAAVGVDVARASASTVHVTLTPRGVGHALPTGDLFRRLEVTAEVAGADHASLAQASRHLARHWRPKRGGVGRALVRDDRLTVAPASIDLDLGSIARGRAIEWRVAYQRVAHPNGIDDDAAEIDGEITVASGRLEP